MEPIVCVVVSVCVAGGVPLVIGWLDVESVDVSLAL
jgi:hypothetical protein